MKYLVSILLMISALQAKADITILIVDTGLSTAREDLTKYVPDTYLDDYEDDYRGKGHEGHGTHVTSLILKNACPQVKIIPCKFTKGEQDNLKNELKCLKLGLKLKVDLVNMSLNGLTYSRAEHKLLKVYEKRKIPVHVALGNEGMLVENKFVRWGGSYPASLNLTNIVKIGSLNKGFFSTHTNMGSGVKYVEGAFWGAAKQPNKQTFMKGTSQATAYYTGLYVKKYCETTKK